MIVSGGMNVYSIEVEEVISKHPKVKQASVIGVPDHHWGEAVTAVVVAEEGCSEEELIEHCRDKMAKYMRPKKIVFQSQLPLTTVGKVDKKTLRAAFWSGKTRNVN